MKKAKRRYRHRSARTGKLLSAKRAAKLSKATTTREQVTTSKVHHHHVVGEIKAPVKVGMVVVAVHKSTWQKFVDWLQL